MILARYPADSRALTTDNCFYFSQKLEEEKKQVQLLQHKDGSDSDAVVAATLTSLLEGSGVLSQLDGWCSKNAGESGQNA